MKTKPFGSTSQAASPAASATSQRTRPARRPSSWTPPAANKLTYTGKGSHRLHSLRLPFSYGFYDARFTAPKYQPPSPSDTAPSTLSRIT